MAAGKLVLEFDVAELIEGAYLPEDTAPVGVCEESHQCPRQPVMRCQPYPNQQV